MTRWALVDHRNEPIAIDELSMRCDATETPSPLDQTDQRQADRFIAAVMATGSAADHAGADVTLDVAGMAAFHIVGGRMLCIVAPEGPEAALWMNVDLAEVSVSVASYEGVRKRPSEVMITVDGIQLRVIQIHRRLSRSMQAHQGAAFLAAVSVGAPPTPAAAVRSEPASEPTASAEQPQPWRPPEPQQRPESHGQPATSDGEAKERVSDRRGPWVWVAAIVAAALVIGAVIAITSGGGDKDSYATPADPSVLSLPPGTTGVPTQSSPPPSASPETTPVPQPAVFVEASASGVAAADGSLRLALDGVGEIIAPPGALAPGSEVSAATVELQDAPNVPAGFVPAVPAIDVIVPDGALLGLLEMRVNVVPDDPAMVPAVLHLGEFGRWDVRAASADGVQMSLWSGDFSINLFGWFQPADWARSVGGAIDDAFDWTVGRTDKPARCEGVSDDPYEWAIGGGTVANGAIHACALRNPRADGTERVEVLIKSNRDYDQWVTFTQHETDYVWVEGLGVEWRKAIGWLTGRDYTHEVLLPAGKSMTVGYTRPAVDSADITFKVDADPFSAALTVLTDALGLSDKTELIAVALECGAGAFSLATALTAPEPFDLADAMGECAVSGVATGIERFTKAGALQLIKEGRFAISGSVATESELISMSTQISSLRTASKLVQLPGQVLMARDAFNMARDLTIQIASDDIDYVNTYSLTLIPPVSMATTSTTTVPSSPGGTFVGLPDPSEWTFFEGVEYEPNAEGGFTLAASGTYWPGVAISTGGACNYRLELDAKLLEGDGYGVYLRTTFNGSAPATGRGFQYNPGASGLSDHEAPYVENGIFTTEPTDDEWHHLDLVVNTSQFSWSIDGRTAFVGETTATCGDIWLRIWRSRAEFKNLQFSVL